MKFMQQGTAAVFYGFPAAGEPLRTGAGADSWSVLGMAWYTWVLIVFCVICAALTAWYWSLPARKEARRLKALALLAGTGAVLMGAFNASGLWTSGERTDAMNLIQIYGMTYDADGSRAMFATHEGIVWFGGEKWQAGNGERHDYIGFAPYKDGFYASGKPGPGSKLPNPIGLVKSTDGGVSIDILALAGEVNFRLLGVSYRHPMVYGYNETAGPTLKQPGLYYSADEGKTWTQSAMKGFEGQPTAIAIHPDNPDYVVLGARDGLFLSKDRGESFMKRLPDMGISALSFDLDGTITVGGFKGRPSMLQLDAEGKPLQEIHLPDLKGDAIAFVAHNPVKPEERVFSTYEHNIYHTADGGASWYQLATNAKTKPQPELAPKMPRKE